MIKPKSHYNCRFLPTSEDGGFHGNKFCEARFSGTTQYPWKVYQKKLPEHLEKYALEIDRVFNDNVHFGCCGGCL